MVDFNCDLRIAPDRVFGNRIPSGCDSKPIKLQGYGKAILVINVLPSTNEKNESKADAALFEMLK